jgi:hypothetical protein
MDSVRDMADGHLNLGPAREKTSKNSPANFGMETTDPVYRCASANRQVRHIEGFIWIVRMQTTQSLQAGKIDTQVLLCISLKDATNQIRRETIESGSDRGMGSEHVSGTRHTERDFKRLAAVLHETQGTLEHGQRCMALVYVADLRFDPQRPHKPPSRYSENHLLGQAQLSSTAIELARDASICRKIRRVVTVKKIELYPTNLRLPRT